MFARHVRALGSIACGCFLLLLPPMAAAQTNTHPSSTPRVVDPPAGVVLGGHGASIVRGDHTTPATADVPLVHGDRLRTAQDGAVLARVDERTVLWLADDSEVTLRGATDLQLIRGQMILLVDGWPVSPLEMLRRERLTLDAPGGAIAFVMPGDYEVTVDDDLDSTIVHVRAGEAVLKNGGEQVLLASSRSASRIGRLRVEKAPGKLRRSPLVDKGDRSDETWLALVQLRDPKRLWSARYLPPSLTPHAPYFERAGDWEWDEVHGFYWVPRVDASWQPFTNGAWTQASGGWLWRGAGGPWEGPTHHYGRWAILANGEWAWRPGEEWSPGWVAWAHTSDYMAWCPLGWDDRPIYDFTSDYWHDNVRPDGRRWTWSFSRRADGARERRPETSGRPSLAVARPSIVVQPSRHPRPVASAVPRGGGGATAGGAVPRTPFDLLVEEVRARHARERRERGEPEPAYSYQSHESSYAPARHGSGYESSSSSSSDGSSGAVPRSGYSSSSGSSDNSGSSGAVSRSGSSGSSGSSGAVPRSGSSDSSSGSSSSSSSSGRAPRRHP